MDSLQATYKDDDEEEEEEEQEEEQDEEEEETQQPTKPIEPSSPSPPPPPLLPIPIAAMDIEQQNDTEPLQNPTENPSLSPSESPSESDRNPKTEEDENDDEADQLEENDELDDDEPDNNNNGLSPSNKKRKSLSSLTLQVPKHETPDEELEEQTLNPQMLNNNQISLPNGTETTKATTTTTTSIAVEATKAAQMTSSSTKKKSKSKKKKKTGNSVWLTRSTRKGKKKAKPTPQNTPAEDKVLITPVPRFFDKSDDSPEMSICLSKVYKAEKVELSEDRLTAGSTKGYRMVRATRGVCEGAWYYEIKVVRLGETGHTRLGWSTEKGDLQAPVGYDGSSFGYRDVDGSKVHKALRDKYGEEGYKEGDVIGFYINLPEGGSFAPKLPQLVWYKGQRYLCAQDPEEDPPKIVPGSEISFFKNGVCQGVAFKDLYGGRYYPAASMYTLPNQPNCEVKFNFGPDFDVFPKDFGGRPVPRPMIEVSYHGYDHRVENGVSDEKKQ